MLGRLLRKPLTWVALAVLAATAAFALYWFTPWKIFTNKTVSDALSTPAPAATAVAAPGASTPGASTKAAGPALIAKGTFVSHEHGTSGEVRVVRQPDGSRQLEIVNLDTSDGPDLWVYLSDQPVKNGKDGWFVFDDGKYLDLAKLKGNKGNQVYALPADVDLGAYRSVSIWCKRFSVSFGAAELDQTSGG